MTCSPARVEDDDAAGNGAVTVARSLPTVAKGQQFTVTVTQDAASLFAFDLTVGFDAKAFSLVSAVPGPSGDSYTRDRPQLGDGRSTRGSARHPRRRARRRSSR